MNLTDTRRDVAAQLTAALDDVTVHPYRPIAARAGDGWLILSALAPATFGTCTATFDLIVVVGIDAQAAEQALDATAVALIDTLGHVGSPVTVTAQALTLGGAELFCATATFLVEVGN